MILDKSTLFISPLPQSPQTSVLTKSFSPRSNWNWVRVLCILCLHLIIVGSHPAFANQALAGPPWSFLEQHREQILQLSSDDEALVFFQSIFPPKNQISRTRTQSPPSTKNVTLSEEVKEAAILYLASLAVTAHARTIQKHIVQLSPANPLPSGEISGEPQLKWMMKQTPLQTLKPMIDFYIQVSAWRQAAASQPHPSGNEYAAFATYYDQTYPDWDDSPLSWTNLYTLHGQKGIEERLFEYWQTLDHPADQHPSPSIKNAYAQYYIGTRLLPMFRANLLAQSIRVETMAYETSWKSWHDIQEWQQQEQTQSATARLCGTWQWVVHNHQNHGDHKMVITFSSLKQSSPSQPQPTTITIQGDTVYLKWTFPQGFQEDSLLLSNRDTHLEGTFKNSLGPHGSISGKRLTSCQS